MKKYLVLILLLVGVLFFFFVSQKPEKPKDIIPVITPTIEPTKSATEIFPIAEFRQGITKKPFGIYITPKASPVQPERFQGYHTGVDVEYEDAVTDVPVFAVCSGDLVLSRWVSGYGGTAVIKCSINSADYYFLYGHLRLSSITKTPKVSKGDQVAVLGKDHTQETDFERQHLHFSIHKNSLDLRGYVQTEGELSGWLDPLSIVL